MMTPLTESTAIQPKPKVFKTANEFSYFIEQEAIRRREECYSVILDYCEKNDVEYEKLVPMVNTQLKEKLAIEFSEMGMLPKQSSLF